MKKFVISCLILSSMISSPVYAALYFPHVDTSLPWQTEIAVINAGDQAVTGTLRGMGDGGQLVETKAVTLPARGRRQIAVAAEFTNTADIGYIVFDTDSDAVQGYTKFYQAGVYRAAIPAVKEVNTSDIYLSHIDSSALWWTGVSLVNTTSARKDLIITFNTGQSVPYTLNANEHKAFTIAGLFNNQPQPEIQSAVITNASGVIGLELFGSNGSGNQLDGILLTGTTASTLYYPHVASDALWWTGVVAYNPSSSAATITVTPYSGQGTALSPSTLSLAGKGKYVGLVSGLGLPGQTAWFKIDSTSPLSGFELFGTGDGKQVAAYPGGGTGAKSGVFAKVEKSGWTGIAFVNTEAGAASVTLTAYDDNGAVVATQTLSVGGHAKVVNYAESIFSQSIGSATYIAYTSDQNVVGFQLNGSADGMMLDGLPALGGAPRPDGNVPTASFTFAPAAPVAGQTVAFTDTSTGSPTTWSWSFGDGTVSSVQNPNHAYAAAGTFTVTLTAGNAAGASTVSHAVAVSPSGSVALGSFHGNIILGAPTTTSIKASVFSTDQTGMVSIHYGKVPGTYDKQTAATELIAGKPLVLTVEELTGNTRYYYRLYFQAPDGTGSGPTDEYTFHTARPAGSTFTFTIQADSHLDENSDLDVYRQALSNVHTDTPDFHVDLGDTFMCEKKSAPMTATNQTAPDQATVDARYVYERANFGLVTHSAPLFLVNGNHDGEQGWATDGTAQNIAIWTTLARQRYFLNPAPDGFYSGDSTEEPFVGKRASWYAWQWGDALFVALDPYWYTKTKSNNDGWVYTLGEKQYQWLQATLSSSPAKYKFVFIHSLVGGLDGQIRGGKEAAPFFEWGGRNLDGTMGLSQKRPGWSVPIHELLLRYGVTAVFHGHDHLYAKQALDGVVYQEVPQPSAKNFSNGPSLATAYHYAAGTILSSTGHIRVTVSPDRVTGQYVRAWLPKNETDQRKNGQVDDTWSMGAP